MAYEYGNLVSDSEAHTYVENYRALRARLIDEVLPQPVPETASQEFKDSVAFHKSKVNAFLFDAELIKKLFEGSEPAPYIAVFLGATGTNPTVVIAGLHVGSPNKLTARPEASKPEFPTLLPDVKFPSIANGEIDKP